MLLRPEQADRHGPVLPLGQLWRVELSGGGAVPARVEGWETGMGKRVDSVHKLQENLWVQNAQVITWAGEP